MSLLDAAGVVTGDIWCNGAFSFESPLKDLLDSGEYTLEQLLAEDELLQELRGLHPQLIEFLSTEESVAGLIQYVILPPEAKPPNSFASVSSNNGTNSVENIEGGERSKGDDASGVKKNGESVDDENISKEETAAPETIEEKPNKEPGKWLLGEDMIEEKSIPVPQQSEQEVKDTLYVRFPYMACEVICCEIKGIVDILVDGFVPSSVEQGMKNNEENNEIPQNGNNAEAMESASENISRGRPILDLLFSVLYDSAPGEIDDYRAGYFDKILSVLFRKRSQAMSDYINGGGGRGSDVLMAAMFKHLYSHSIMQIVQRLLLPQPPMLSNPEDQNDNEEGEDLFADTMEGAETDGLELFHCDWSQSGKALEMLLDCLIGNKIAPQVKQDEEKKLSLYQNASEVLITIIQNSPLTSPTLHSLTSDPVLEKLALSATTINESETFSNHDSRLTCAMNVLESLILQLGGYGSVGTMLFPEEGEGEIDLGESEVPISGEETSGVVQAPAQNPPPTMTQQDTLATSDTLVLHLPTMLSSLSEFLRFEGAEQWVSPMQFSKSHPQNILGSSRLRIVRLLESLVLLGDPSVDAILCNSDCLEVCLDLFWKFQWCSMLHQSVANLLVHVFEGQNSRSELQSYFISRCNLLGRLMGSFWEGTEDCIPSPANISNAEISQTLMDKKYGGGFSPPVTSLASEKGSADNDILPVSDDDVDAAMEQQEDITSDNVERVEQSEDSERAAQDVPDHTPPQSFRLGYMGHVIIICQALVHACTNDGKSEAASLAGGAISEEMDGELDTFVSNFGGEKQESSQVQESAIEHVEREKTLADETTKNASSATPLVLAQLVDSHPLSRNWQEFVATTLATETAIQSSPLGGFQGVGPGMEAFQGHRPGLAEDGGFDDDDGAAPPLPPRGLLVGGDVIDMDDNDLDVAASMMAGMRLHQPDESGDDRSRDLLSGIAANSNGPTQDGYVFDDPLGDGRFGKFIPNDDNDDSSSDEESEQSGNTGDSGGAVADGSANGRTTENDAPVMDLFAGNFDAFGEKDVSSSENGTWSDFANFDDAFGSAQTSDDPAVEGKSNLDDVFGDMKDHAMLLEEIADPAAAKDEESKEADLSDTQALDIESTAENPTHPQQTTVP